MQDLDKKPIALQGYEGGNLSFSPDSRVIVSDNGRGKIMIWDILGSARSFYTGIRKFFFSPDNKYVVGWGRNQILAYDINDKKSYTQTFEGLHPFDDVKFSLNLIAIHTGRSILTMNIPKSFNEAPSPTALFPARDLWNMVFSSDGRYLAAWSRNGGFMVWDMQKDNIIPTLLHDRKDGIVRDLAFSPTGDYLFASITPDKGKSRVNVWNMRSLNVKVKLSDFKIESGLRDDIVVYDPSMVLEGEEVKSIIFSPDGSNVALLETPYNIKIGNVRDINVVSTVLKSPISLGGMYEKLFFSPGGRYWVAQEESFGAHGDNKVVLWDTYNLNKEQEPITLQGRIIDIAFSPDDRFMALVKASGIRLYNMGGIFSFEEEEKIRAASEEPSSNTFLGEARQTAEDQLQRAQQGVAALFGGVLQKAREWQASRPELLHEQTQAQQQDQPERSELKEQEEKKQVAEQVTQESSAKKIYPSRFDVVQQQQAQERVQAQQIRKEQEKADQLRRFKERAAQRGSLSRANMLLERSNKDLLESLFPKKEPQPK